MPVARVRTENQKEPVEIEYYALKDPRNKDDTCADLPALAITEKTMLHWWEGTKPKIKYFFY